MHYEKFADGSVKCIEDEIPFELPEGWLWERLSNIASFSGGKTPSTSKRDYWGNEMPWVTSMDMKSKYITGSQVMLSSVGTDLMQVYQSDTILLVTRSGILRHTLPVAILKVDATVNQDLKAISLYIPELAEYVYVCFKGMESRLLSTYAKSGTTVENINFDEFSHLLLPFPGKNLIEKIQEAVASAEEQIDLIEYKKESLVSTIALTKAKILDMAIRGQLVPQNPDDEPASVLLERIRAEKEELIKQGKIKRDKKESIIFRGDDNSYYEKMTDGRTRCIDDELPFELPDGWEWCNLSMIGSTNIGLTYRPDDIAPTGTMVLRSSNIVNDCIDLNDLVRVNTSIRDNQCHCILLVGPRRTIKLLATIIPLPQKVLCAIGILAWIEPEMFLRNDQPISMRWYKNSSNLLMNRCFCILGRNHLFRTMQLRIMLKAKDGSKNIICPQNWFYG